MCSVCVWLVCVCVLGELGLVTVVVSGCIENFGGGVVGGFVGDGGNVGLVVGGGLLVVWDGGV